MEIKKSPKANLENKKLLFMEIGLVIALLMVLGAFEWSTSEGTDLANLGDETAVVIEEEQVPITQEEQLPPPEVPKEPVMSDIIDIVDDDIKVEDNFLISTGIQLGRYILLLLVCFSAYQEPILVSLIQLLQPLYPKMSLHL